MNFSGTVIHGDGEGRRLGYPTANIEAIVEPGIYAGHVEWRGENYVAALFANAKRPILEAHFLDFDADLYGETIVIHIEKKLRDSQVYTDEESLKRAIQGDVQTVREYYKVT